MVTRQISCKRRHEKYQKLTPSKDILLAHRASQSFTFNWPNNQLVIIQAIKIYMVMTPALNVKLKLYSNTP